MLPHSHYHHHHHHQNFLLSTFFTEPTQTASIVIIISYIWFWLLSQILEGRTLPDSFALSLTEVVNVYTYTVCTSNSSTPNQLCQTRAPDFTNLNKDCPCFYTHITQPVHFPRTPASLFSNATYSRIKQSKKWVEHPKSWMAGSFPLNWGKMWRRQAAEGYLAWALGHQSFYIPGSIFELV